MLEQNNILAFKLNDTIYLTKLRSIVDGGSIAYSNHAKTKMRLRKVSAQQVLYCLRFGKVIDPAHVSITGSWTAKLGYYTAGDYVQVVAAISTNKQGEYVLIVTVIS